MAQSQHHSVKPSTLKQSTEVIKIEDAIIDDHDGFLQQYPLLAGLSREELDSLNKTVVSKLDWKFLPCITAMLLMK